MISPPGVEVTSAPVLESCVGVGIIRALCASPRDWGTGIFFRSHTFICVCPKLLFSVVWENYSGSWIPNKDKTCRILGWVGVRLLLNWQKFAGDSMKREPCPVTAWVLPGHTHDSPEEAHSPISLHFKYHKDLMTHRPPSHVVSTSGLSLWSSRFLALVALRL